MERSGPRTELGGGQAGARSGRRDEFRHPDKPRFVAGVLGPTSTTASISPDVNDPGCAQRHLRPAGRRPIPRQIARPGGRRRRPPDGRDHFRHAQRQGRAVRHRAVLRRARPVEAAGDDFRHHHRRLRAARCRARPTEAFWNSVRHAKPFSIGLNCALGAEAAAPLCRGTVRESPTASSQRHPNAGLPNRASAATTKRPDRWRKQIARMGASRAFSISSAAAAAPRPTHIKAIAEAVEDLPPRKLPESSQRCACPGWSRSTSATTRCSSTSASAPTSPARKAFARMILEGHYDDALAVARQQVENGAQVIDINMDEAMLDAEAAMARFLNLIASEPDIARVPLMIDSSKWERDRGRAQVRAGQVHRQFDLDEGRRGRSSSQRGQTVPALRRGGGRDGLRRSGPGRHLRAQDRDLRSAPTNCWSRQSASRPRTSSSTPTSSRSPPASRSTPTTRWTSSRPPAGSSRTCRTPRSRGGVSNVSLLVPRQRRRCARRSTPSSSTTRSRPAWTWASSTPGSSASTTTRPRTARARRRRGAQPPPRCRRAAGRVRRRP